MSFILYPSRALLQMDADMPGFYRHCVDVAGASQNGISGLSVDPEALLEEAGGVTRAGGKMFFSHYS